MKFRIDNSGNVSFLTSKPNTYNGKEINCFSYTLSNTQGFFLGERKYSAVCKWFSNCGSLTNSIIIICELVMNTHSQI